MALCVPAHQRYHLFVCFAALLISLFTSGCTPSSQGSTDLKKIPLQGAQEVGIFVEPDDGASVITQALLHAQSSIWLEMYLLTSRTVIKALEEAAYAGRDVRVMLEMHPYGSTTPTATIDRLRAAGVQVQGTNPAFALTHEKGMVIDQQTAYIMTCNFTRAALGEGSGQLDREYGILSSNPQDVQAVMNIFLADWNRSKASLSSPSLIVSPENSRQALSVLLNQTRHTLLIEAEEMQDNAIEQLLISAVRRGVQVRVILPSPQDGQSESNQPTLQTLQRAGVQIQQMSQLYMHAKMLLMDDQLGFVGSENISTASLDQNRELGILISHAQALDRLHQTFELDWQRSIRR